MNKNAPFYAIICTWNEEDIIHSTVKHAFMQGCDDVYIVDNGSTDSTISRALRAGAKHFATFHTRYFNEDSKIMALNNAVASLNKSLGHKAAWWLYIDADEFPTAPGFKTLRSFIHCLPANVRVIKSQMINHYPTHSPYFWEAYHPLDFQPWGKKVNTTKLQLLRYDLNDNHITSLGGAHDYYANGTRLPQSATVLNLHHFNYRTPEATLGRLKELARVREDGTSRLDWMDGFERTSKGVKESMYRHRLINLQKHFIDNKNMHYLSPEHEFWDFRMTPRWYSTDELYAAIYMGLSSEEATEFIAFHSWLEGNTDKSLVFFNRLAKSLQKSSQNASIPFYAMGRILLESSDFSSACGAFSQALMEKPDPPLQSEILKMSRFCLNELAKENDLSLSELVKAG